MKPFCCFSAQLCEALSVDVKVDKEVPALTSLLAFESWYITTLPALTVLSLVALATTKFSWLEEKKEAEVEEANADRVGGAAAAAFFNDCRASRLSSAMDLCAFRVRLAGFSGASTGFLLTLSLLRRLRAAPAFTLVFVVLRRPSPFRIVLTLSFLVNDTPSFFFLVVENPVRAVSNPPMFSCVSVHVRMNRRVS